MDTDRRHSFHSPGGCSRIRHNSFPKTYSSITPHDYEDDSKENIPRKRIYSDSGIRRLAYTWSRTREVIQEVEQNKTIPLSKSHLTRELSSLSEDASSVSPPQSVTGACGTVEGVMSELQPQASSPIVMRRRTCSAIQNRRSPDQRISEVQMVESVFARHRISVVAYAKYQYTNALEAVLPKVLRKIFFYKYQGPPDLTLEKYYTQILQYSREKLKSIFGTTLRKKLNVTPRQLSGNDVSFWYRLLQLGCNLAPPESKVWYEDIFGNNSLEHLLWELKEMRNARAHGETDTSTLTIQVTLDRLRKLKTLCLSAIEAASVGTGDLDDFMEEIKKDLGQYELDFAGLPHNT